MSSAEQWAELTKGKEHFFPLCELCPLLCGSQLVQLADLVAPPGVLGLGVRGSRARPMAHLGLGSGAFPGRSGHLFKKP